MGVWMGVWMEVGMEVGIGVGIGVGMAVELLPLGMMGVCPSRSAQVRSGLP